MTQTVPTGIFQQDYLLRYLIAGSSTFQSLINTTHGGGATEANALNHVHEPAVEMYDVDGDLKSTTPAPPWAIINPEGQTFNYQIQGIGNWRISGTSAFSLDLVIPSDHATETVQWHKYWYERQAHLIITEMEALRDAMGEGPISGQTHLQFIDISPLGQGPFEIDVEEIPNVDYDTETPTIIWHHMFQVTY